MINVQTRFRFNPLAKLLIQGAFLARKRLLIRLLYQRAPATK
jgi:hypothetical protein